MTATGAGMPGTTPPPTTERATTADPERRRISARVRILLWLLLVMAVALASVAATTRSILLRDTDQRINGLLAQEAGEFHQTPRGKIPAEVARRAKLYGRPVLALAGTLGEGAHEVPGVDACHGIIPAPMALADALLRASELLTDASERALRMVLLGSRLPGRAAQAAAEVVPPEVVSGTQRPSSVR